MLLPLSKIFWYVIYYYYLLIMFRHMEAMGAGRLTTLVTVVSCCLQEFPGHVVVAHKHFMKQRIFFIDKNGNVGSVGQKILAIVHVLLMSIFCFSFWRCFCFLWLMPFMFLLLPPVTIPLFLHLYCRISLCYSDTVSSRQMNLFNKILFLLKKAGFIMC